MHWEIRSGVRLPCAPICMIGVLPRAILRPRLVAVVRARSGGGSDVA